MQKSRRFGPQPSGMPTAGVGRAVRCGLLALAACITQGAQAALVEYDYNSVVTGTMGGTGPWLNVKIQDVSPGTVQFTVTSLLGSTPALSTQTLTGLWFNIPGVATPLNLTSLGFGAASGSGAAPSAFVAPIFTAPAGNQSGVTTSSTLVPAGTTAALVGRYDLVIRFPNNPPAFQGFSQEVFDLVANASSGLDASDFVLSTPTAGGPSYFSVASFTNANGTGSGTAFITASPVPLPASVLLLVPGLGVLGLLRRRGTRAHQA